MSLPRRRLTLATVLVEGFLGRLTFGMTSFALPLYAAAIGVPLSRIGILIGARTIVALPFKPLAGVLADRVGLRRVYLLSIALRTLSGALLLVAGDFASLLLVRVLQGASSAGRDVGSLGLIARESGAAVGSHYGRYVAAKHVGTIGGAALAGALIAAGGGRLHAGAYRPLFLLVLALSVLPLVVAALGLREPPRTRRAGRQRPRSGGRLALDGLGGAASVGVLVATSAYMVHGLYPVLATEYAGLTELQAGVVYSASGAVFVVAAPLFGRLIDHRGRALGIALRSLCNVGSSVLYVAFPSLPGIAAARCVDDSGKAAFQPAWAAVVASVSAEDPERSGRRLATLDTAATVGEALGPALATLLWGSGGILLLFGIRILVAVGAEVAAFAAFGELRGLRLPRLRGSAPRTGEARARA